MLIPTINKTTARALNPLRLLIKSNKPLLSIKNVSLVYIILYIKNQPIARGVQEITFLLFSCIMLIRRQIEIVATKNRRETNE